MGPTTGIAVGLLAVGLGLFVVARARRNRQPPDPVRSLNNDENVAVRRRSCRFRGNSVNASDVRLELEAANLEAARAAVGRVPLHAASIDTPVGVIAFAGHASVISSV